jgi:hypothetical protein
MAGACMARRPPGRAVVDVVVLRSSTSHGTAATTNSQNPGVRPETIAGTAKTPSRSRPIHAAARRSSRRASATTTSAPNATASSSTMPRAAATGACSSTMTWRASPTRSDSAPTDPGVGKPAASVPGTKTQATVMNRTTAATGATSRTPRPRSTAQVKTATSVTRIVVIHQSLPSTTTR